MRRVHDERITADLWIPNRKRGNGTSNGEEEEETISSINHIIISFLVFMHSVPTILTVYYSVRFLIEKRGSNFGCSLSIPITNDERRMMEGENSIRQGAMIVTGDAANGKGIRRRRQAAAANVRRGSKL